MQLEIAVATHVGLVREGNQDAVLLDGWVGQARALLRSSDRDTSDRPVLVAVLDGLGGHAGGELASVVAAHALSSDASGWREVSEESLSAAIATACARVDHYARLSGELREMATTLVAAVVDSSGVHVVNVGDSRAYAVVDGYLGQLSVDDSAPDGRGGEVVTQVLGSPPRLLDIHYLHRDAMPGTTLLLCSDGLHGVVSVGQLTEILNGDGELDARAWSLVTAAVEAGGPDNVSVALIRVKPAEEMGVRGGE